MEDEPINGLVMLVIRVVHTKCILISKDNTQMIS